MKITAVLHLFPMLALAACAAPVTTTPTPATQVSAPTLTETTRPAATATAATPPATATAQLEGPFSGASHSSNVFHLKCDPQAIIFDVVPNSPQVDGVAFFFRMVDKGSGIASDWSSGQQMKKHGNGIFELILQAKAIPDEARFREAWLEYQFVAANNLQQVLGRSQIFSGQITFTPDCA